MSIYLVTWKSSVIEGKNSEGSFVSESEMNSVDDALRAREGWVEYAEAENPYRYGVRLSSQEFLNYD